MSMTSQARRRVSSSEHVIPRQPLVVVLGATGTGKSQLAVELSKRFNGEVINGDAMQLYAGLPIITNKITQEEQQGILHHLLGCIGLNEPTWVVSTFVKRAGQVIQDIRARGKLPVVVGGTHYYTQSLLFRDALVDAEQSDIDNKDEPLEQLYPILGESTETIMSELKKIDPEMAARWHPNDRRKIQRSLMINLQTGKTASQTYEEQRLAREQSSHQVESPGQHVASLQHDALFFWVHTAPDVLQQRLNRRVETMLENGLLHEVKSLHDHATQETSRGEPIDDSRGIWVSIGYKEFKGYQGALEAGADEKSLSRALADGIERTKIANRQYAKRQVTWIKYKLTESLVRAGADKDLYLLDSTKAENFDTDVVKPAAELTKLFLAGLPRPDPKTISSVAAATLGLKRQEPSKSFVAQTCAACDTTCATQDSWDAHLRSKKHKKLSRSVDGRSRPD